MLDKLETICYNYLKFKQEDLLNGVQSSNVRNVGTH